MAEQRLDPVGLSVFNSALVGIAEEMGAVLVRSAYSSNIKERRDCSAALFDARGRMIAQAAHIPGHLGAMPDAVAPVLDLDPREGDVFALNDPFSGGTHLPDITLVSPIVQGELIGFATTRAHHSDIGGMAPGSMPSDSREIYQEGLVIPPVRLVRSGVEERDLMSLLLANVRTPDIRRGDLRAQLAANRLGASRLGELALEHGLEGIIAGFDQVIGYGEQRARAGIRHLADGRYEAAGALEGDGVTADDIPICVAVEIRGDQVTLDFAGSASAVAGNVNCTVSVTRSACRFAVRLLLAEDVPNNAGTYTPISIRTEPGSVVHAIAPSAVVAGNVETCQCICDVVLRALSQVSDLPAEGQGSMNNLIIGGRDWTYYETIGGGQGASVHGPGASGLHVGMTNTLNTPIEALELEYPMRVERYELRYGSGGVGRHRGGDGVVRSVRVLERASVSLLTEHRRSAPRGVQGGEDGAPGENLLNNDTALAAKVRLELEPDDVVSVCTPGGGGWGVSERGEEQS